MERLRRIEKETNLSRLFLQFTLWFCVGTLSAVLTVGLIFSFMAGKGLIMAANAAEQQLEAQRKYIESGGGIQEVLPEGCSYGIYSDSGRYLEGDLTAQGAQEVWRDVKEGKKTAGGWFYKTFVRKDGSQAVALYHLAASFTNPWLQKYFLPPVPACIVLFLCLFFLFVALITRAFGRRVSLELKTLQDMTVQIQEENLEFVCELSRIREIRQTQETILKLKDSLRQSLKDQWEMENTRKNQMAALGHDLKTPLTILRGSAELMGETGLDKEQRDYQEAIVGYAQEMQRYLKILQEVNVTGKSLAYTPSRVQLMLFWEGAVKQACELAKTKGIDVEERCSLFQGRSGKEDIAAILDEDLMHRALSNVISNAVEYTPSHSVLRLTLNVDLQNSMIEFVTEDSGPGFSEEDRKKALSQFYQGDKSRSQKGHYGMGLYIVSAILNLHGGSVELENSQELPGAKVSLRLPWTRASGRSAF